MYKQKSFNLKPAEADKKWFHIDATDMVVGRLATRVADLLRGKGKPTYTPNTDAGDFVVITNCEKVRFTGNKLDQKVYYRHSNHIVGLKQRTVREQLERRPDLVLMSAVKGMLPKNSLGRQQLTKLKIYAGDKHPHEAQNPETVTKL